MSLTQICLKPLIVMLVLVVVFVSFGRASTNSGRYWIMKSKEAPIYTLWSDGSITQGEPEDSSSSSSVVALTVSEYNVLRSSKKWFKNNDAIFTKWRGQQLTYDVSISQQGNYLISLSAKNNASGQSDGSDPSQDKWKLVEGYKYFLVDVYIGNRKKGTLKIEASDTQINTGQLLVKGINAGDTSLKFAWRNDAYKPSKQQDVNIEIHSIQIKRSTE